MITNHLLPHVYDDDGLAPYAVPNEGGKGRKYPEKQKPYEHRNRFQIDRGRVTFSDAYRALDKAQVFSTESDERHLYSTRLTHTVETSDISKDIARALNVNHDLAEAVARAHDLGHPAFGHEGGAGLQEWGKDHGVIFEHNQQTLRIVTLLATHRQEYRGLNLNCETLDALESRCPGFQTPLPSVEAGIVNYADDIAYISRDIYDGISGGLFQKNTLEGLELVKNARDYMDDKTNNINSILLFFLVSSLIGQTRKNIDTLNVQNLQNVCQVNSAIVSLPDDVSQNWKQMKDFLHGAMYASNRKQPYADAAKLVMQRLCNYFIQGYPDAVSFYQMIAEENNDAEPLARAIIDYVSTFTDAEVLTLAKCIGVSKSLLKKITMIS